MDTMQTLKLLVLAPFALAACGGGDANTQPTTPSNDMSMDSGAMPTSDVPPAAPTDMAAQAPAAGSTTGAGSTTDTMTSGSGSPTAADTSNAATMDAGAPAMDAGAKKPAAKKAAKPKK
jgi:hypothetical protein